MVIKSIILESINCKPFLICALVFIFTLLDTNLACAVTTSIIIHPDKIVAQVNSRLLGTNTSMWRSPDEYENPTFINRTKHSGIGLIRIPGGSNADQYGWLSCELRAEPPAYPSPAYPSPALCGDQGEWGSWVSRPTDFINFLRATGNEAMFTINVNITRQEAAAAVAFFNAKPDNQTVIGVDRKGFDWKTAGYWAQLRAEHGNPEPFRIKYWEIGNEVYLAKQATGGDQCTEWGKENAWTCDGT